MTVLANSDNVPLDEISQIIDSSSLAKYASKEPNWEQVEKYISSADSLDLAIIETSNAMWKKIQKKEIELEHASKIIKTLLDTVWLLDEKKYLQKALDISTKNHITIYDALFLACALTEHCYLVSSDAKQVKIAEELHIKTILV